MYVNHEFGFYEVAGTRLAVALALAAVTLGEAGAAR
jgi:hypothetical protein